MNIDELIDAYCDHIRQMAPKCPFQQFSQEEIDFQIARFQQLKMLLPALSPEMMDVDPDNCGQIAGFVMAAVWAMRGPIAPTFDDLKRIADISNDVGQYIANRLNEEYCNDDGDLDGYNAYELN